MLLAFGMVSALLAVRNRGTGQVIDCAMTDGAALLGASIRTMLNNGMWQDARGVNYVDGGAPYYATYACKDGHAIAIGALEPEFYQILRQLTGTVDDPDFDEQHDRRIWPTQREKLASIFATRTRDEWCVTMAGSDACFSPVLSIAEATQHPVNASRELFIPVGDALQPAPAPRFSATPATPPRAQGAIGTDRDAILAELGLNSF